MHNPGAEGNEFFLCDFCRRPWSEQRPMVEGHRGSLVCAACLSTAYTDLVHLQGGDTSRPGETCTLCLERRSQRHWRSPLYEQAIICLRCVKQSSTAMEKDPEVGWKRPPPPPGVEPSGETPDEP